MQFVHQYANKNPWTANLTAFKVKLVDFGADGNFGGGDDKEHQVTLSTPTLNAWNSYEIPLADFTGLTTKAHIAQYILVGNPTGTGTVFIDNVYFHKVPFVDPNIPTIAAPTPTFPAADIISMFSNAYTNKTVDTWRTSWSAATLTDLQIATNDTKKYSALDFVGIETVGANQINATSMKWFHLDAWTPNLTTFKVKLVDFGADGAFGGGDDKEHELTLTAPTLKAWNSYDLLLSDFTGLTTRAHLAQYILVGAPTGTGTVYIDNVYFRKASIGINTTENGTTKLYPNPASTSVTFEANQKVESISLFNVLGQEVVSTTPNSTFVTLDIASLPKGVYIVKSIIEGTVSTSRLVKE